MKKLLTKAVLLAWAVAGVAELTESTFAQRRGRGYRAGGSMRYSGQSNRSYSRGSSRSYGRSSRSYGGSSSSRSNQQAWQDLDRALQNRGTSKQAGGDRSGTRASATGASGRESVQNARNQPDGTYNRETRGGGSLESTKSTSGDTTTRTTTVTGREGNQAQAQTQVKRDGDEASYNRNVRNSQGDSRSSSGNVERDGDTLKYERDIDRNGFEGEAKGEIKFDDGQVDKVERETKLEGPGGESIERKQELEREDGYFKYEGETKTSTGRKVETEGYVGRDIYGRPVAYGVADTKYWGDFGVARGPNGGRVVASLPSNYYPAYYWGYPYYHYGGLYYGSYYWGSAWYYYPAYAPYGAIYYSIPVGSTTVVYSSTTYYYNNYTYYEKAYEGGEVAYKVVKAPIGAEHDTLPAGYALLELNGFQYFYYNNTFYRRTQQQGKTVYVVVEEPLGITTVKELPADFEPWPVDQVTFFKTTNGYYLPYVDGESQTYLQVDGPAPVTPSASATGVAVASQGTQSEIVVQAGSRIRIRSADSLDSGTNQVGDPFAGYLDSDLATNGRLVAAKGSRVYGKVTAVDKAGNLSGKAELTIALSDILINDVTMPISTAPYRIDGEKAKTLGLIGGGTGTGALIGGLADGWEGAAKGAAVGAVAGTVVAAATPGKQVQIPAQTLLEFQLAEPLTLTVPVV